MVSSSSRPRSVAHDRVERLPAAGGAAGAAVDDEILGVLGDLGVEVVHQHPQRGFLLPALAGQLGAAGGADEARGGDTEVTVLSFPWSNSVLIPGHRTGAHCDRENRG